MCIDFPEERILKIKLVLDGLTHRTLGPDPHSSLTVDWPMKPSYDLHPCHNETAWVSGGDVPGLLHGLLLMSELQLSSSHAGTFSREIRWCSQGRGLLGPAYGEQLVGSQEIDFHSTQVGWGWGLGLGLETKNQTVCCCSLFVDVRPLLLRKAVGR